MRRRGINRKWLRPSQMLPVHSFVLVMKTRLNTSPMDLAWPDWVTHTIKNKHLPVCTQTLKTKECVRDRIPPPTHTTTTIDTRHERMPR